LFQGIGPEFPILLDKTQCHPDPAAILEGLLQFGFEDVILRFGLALAMALAMAPIVNPLWGRKAALINEDLVEHFIRAVLLQVKGMLSRLAPTTWLVLGIFGVILDKPSSWIFAGGNKGLNRTENEGRGHLVGHEITGQELLWWSEDG
jgi:hypothetical protein